MKAHSNLGSIDLALLLAASGGAIEQNVGSNAGKGAKSTNCRTVKAARKTAARTTSRLEKPSSERDIQETGQNR